VAGVAAPSFQRGDADLNVGVVAPSYGLEHVSYGISVPGVAYHQLQAVTARRLFPRDGFIAHTPMLIGAKSDIVHTFNHLPVNRNFVVSFEMELPRNIDGSAPWRDRFAFRNLTSRRCKQILPLSRAAERFFLTRVPDALRDQLAAKTRVFRGLVTAPPHARTAVPFGDDAPLKLLFVGGGGLRKGLGPVVTAFERLVAAGANMELTIVGRAKARTYALPGRLFDTAPLMQRIADHPRITHHASAPNATVKALMASHHVFLLPTIDESLGWVVIEAGLSGMAVIATDVFAIPELVQDGVTGRLIPVETDADHRWVHLGRDTAFDQWAPVQDSFATHIEQILTQMIETPEDIAQYGQAGRAHLEALYGQETAQTALLDIYRSATA